MKDSEISAAIRKVFPKHTRAAYSMAKRTAETGVMLCYKAECIRQEVLDQKPKRAPAPGRYQMRARIPKVLEERVKAKAAAESTTINAVIVMLLTEWVEAT